MDPIEFNKGNGDFDEEGLYLNEEDREQLQKMPELEREEILNQRYQKLVNLYPLQ